MSQFKSGKLKYTAGVNLDNHQGTESLNTKKGDRTKWYWTKWHGQNGSNFYRFQFNWIEFLFSNHKSQISDKPKWV